MAAHLAGPMCASGDHGRCSGGHTTPGVLGGWTCSCPCHRHPAIVVSRPPKDTWCHLGADELDRLDHASLIVDRAFDSRAYLVGSCLEHPHWRDVDVRVVLADDEYAHLFRCGLGSTMRADPMWSLICASVSEYLSRLTGLPIDFQVQQRTYATEKFGARKRVPLGLYIGRRDTDDEETP